MSLKKTDKLIAVIGVIILIIAGVGIVLFASTNEENVSTTEPQGEQPKIFEILYKEGQPRGAVIDNKDFTIKPKLFGEGTYVGNIVIKDQDLKSLNIMVEYHDNVCGLLFGKIARSLGADTFTITVTDKDNKVLAKETIKGDGKKAINITIGQKILNSTIEATDLQDAQGKLEELSVSYNVSYKIKISLKVGIWGILREMLKKDSFTLKANYTQFVYEPKEPLDDYNDGSPPTGTDYYTGTSWNWMSYPGKH